MGNFLWFKLQSCQITLPSAPCKIFLMQKLVLIMTSIPLWVYDYFRSIHGTVLRIPNKENGVARFRYLPRRPEWNTDLTPEWNKEIWLQAASRCNDTNSEVGGGRLPPGAPLPQRRSAHHMCTCGWGMWSDKWYTQKDKKQNCFFLIMGFHYNTTFITCILLVFRDLSKTILQFTGQN